MELLQAQNGLAGSITVPADKSISHRSIMFGALATGQTTIKNFLRAQDCLSTLNAFKKLGVPISVDGFLRSAPESLSGFASEPNVLYSGNTALACPTRSKAVL